MPLLAFADIEEQYANDKQLQRADVVNLHEWQHKQPHLPAPLHPIETALFLHSRFYSCEMAKQSIDTFYTCRARFPEFFANRDPFGLEVQRTLDTRLLTFLPDLTHNGFIVFYTRLLDDNLDAFNFCATVKTCDMLLQLFLRQRGCQNGIVLIVDVAGASMAHLIKCNIVKLQHVLLYLQRALPLRLKSLHFVNGVYFMDKIVALFRPFIMKQWQDMLYVHFGDNATIFEYVSEDILPIECGGSKFNATDYYRNVTRKYIENHSDYFKQEESQRADESKRPDNSKYAFDLFGVDGTFKKLVFD